MHSTLREAVDRGFERQTVGDACAAANPASHAAMRQCISGEGRILCRVVNTVEVVATCDAHNR